MDVEDRAGAGAIRPDRLACGGAINAGPLRRTAWWIEPLSFAIVAVVVAATVGLALFVVGR